MFPKKVFVIFVPFILSSDVEPPTTVMTLNFTGENGSMWWNVTTGMPFVSTSESHSFLIGDDVSTTTMPELTTEFIPIYTAQCVANFTGECDSCLRDPFFWTKGPNDTEKMPGIKNYSIA